MMSAIPCFFSLSLLLVLLHAPSLTSASEYRATDDRTWAIVSNKLTDPANQVVYDTFMNECREAAGSKAEVLCDSAERYRLHMNADQPRSVYNYTKTGFLKTRAPDNVISLLNDFWEKNKDKQTIEWGENLTPYHNTWYVWWETAVNLVATFRFSCMMIRKFNFTVVTLTLTYYLFHAFPHTFQERGNHRFAYRQCFATGWWTAIAGCDCQRGERRHGSLDGSPTVFVVGLWHSRLP